MEWRSGRVAECYGLLNRRTGSTPYREFESLLLRTMENEITTTTKIAVFQRKEIRKTIYKNEWWFVIVDVVAVLTDSTRPDGYLKDMRRRDIELNKGWWQIATPLSIETIGGKQNMNCANTEGIFRIIQSIPSPKAEPFKRWLAKVGYIINYQFSMINDQLRRRSLTPNPSPYLLDN